MKDRGSEMSLDPDFSQLESLLHKTVADCMDYLRAAGDINHPGYRPPQFALTPLPTGATAPEKIYEDLRACLLEKPQFMNTHPGFLGWTLGAGNAVNLLPQLLNAAINASVQTPAQTLGLMELETLGWIKAILAWPEDARGLFVSGSAAGNLMALCAARHAAAGESKAKGNISLNRTAVLGSRQTHLSVRRALIIMGLGDEAFRALPCGDDGALNLLEVERHLSGPDKPLCVVATVGSTERGAFDDLEGLHRLCKKHGVWLHADAAWGGWLALDARRRQLVRGLNLADSITLDFHKWPGGPVGTGVVLFKNHCRPEDIFGVENPYLESLSGAEFSFGDMGPELTRPARALNAWVLLRHLGTENIGTALSQCCDFAELLESYLHGRSGLELGFKAVSNVVAVRFQRPDFSHAENDRRTRAIAESLWRDGRFLPSLLSINGRTYLRFCFINHRLQKKDILDLSQTLIGMVDYESENIS